MSFEQAKTIDEVEESSCFEDLAYTRDFGAVDIIDAKKIIKEYFQYWRLPTISELYALRKQNKKDFFNQKIYWATYPFDKDLSNDMAEVRFGMFGNCGWFFPNENQLNKAQDEDCLDKNKTNERYLVLFKKETIIEGAEEETKKIIEKYPFC